MKCDRQSQKASAVFLDKPPALDTNNKTCNVNRFKCQWSAKTQMSKMSKENY